MPLNQGLNEKVTMLAKIMTLNYQGKLSRCYRIRTRAMLGLRDFNGAPPGTPFPIVLVKGKLQTTKDSYLAGMKVWVTDPTWKGTPASHSDSKQQCNHRMNSGRKQLWLSTYASRPAIEGRSSYNLCSLTASFLHPRLPMFYMKNTGGGQHFSFRLQHYWNDIMQWWWLYALLVLGRAFFTYMKDNSEADGKKGWNMPDSFHFSLQIHFPPFSFQLSAPWDLYELYQRIHMALASSWFQPKSS